MSKIAEWALVKFEDGEFDKIRVKEIASKKIQIKKKYTVNYKSKQLVVTVLMLGSKKEIQEKLNFFTIDKNEDESIETEQTEEDDNESDVETTLKFKNKRKHKRDSDEEAEEEIDESIVKKRHKISLTQPSLTTRNGQKSDITITPYNKTSITQSEVCK
jgi:hypothetical protein